MTPNKPLTKKSPEGLERFIYITLAGIFMGLILMGYVRGWFGSDGKHYIDPIGSEDIQK